MRATILIIENNIKASDLISFALQREDYRTISVYDGSTGLRLIQSRRPDIVILDLPEGLDPDSFNVWSQIKEMGLDIQVLMLAEKDETDLAESLRLEYIVKPIRLRELMERVNLMLLRMDTTHRPTVQKLGRITIDYRQAIVSKDSIPIELSPFDYDLFCFLAAQPGRVFSRAELLTNVWGYTGYLGDVRLVDVAIRRLRMKIEDDPGQPKFILTRRKIGYYFVK